MTNEDRVDTQEESEQLPFKGLCLSPDERLVSILEAPDKIGAYPDKFLIVTNTHVHAVPKPRGRVGFDAAKTDLVNSFPLECLVGIKPARGTGGQCDSVIFEGRKWFQDSGIVIPVEVTPQLISALNSVLRSFHGRELFGRADQGWNLRDVTTSPQEKEQLGVQMAGMRDECIRRYTDPRFVHELHRRQVNTAVFNILAGIVFVILVVLVLLLRKQLPK